MQRGSVIAADGVLLGAAWYATRRLAEPRRSAAFLLIVGSAGLLLVDHIHFQYNGLLLGARASAHSVRSLLAVLAAVGKRGAWPAVPNAHTKLGSEAGMEAR